MKHRKLLAIAVLLFVAVPLRAQRTDSVAASVTMSPDSTQIDVVRLKNGVVLKGKIILPLTDGTNRIEVRENYVIEFKMADVQEITKEKATSFNADGSPDISNGNSQLSESDSRNKIENWYLYFALGYGHGYYPGWLRGNLDQIPASATHTSISIEIPGVYWSLADRKTILGVSFNGIGDRYALNSSSLQVNQYLLSFSSMHFLMGGIGDGVFVRADIGIAWLNLQTSFAGSASSEAGGGILLGGGYAFPVSNETRLLLNVNYGFRHVEGDQYGALSINLGVLL